MKTLLLGLTLLTSISSFAVDIDRCNKKIVSEYEATWDSIQMLDGQYSHELLAIIENALEEGVVRMENCLYAHAQINEVKTAIKDLNSKIAK